MFRFERLRKAFRSNLRAPHESIPDTEEERRLDDVIRNMIRIEFLESSSKNSYLDGEAQAPEIRDFNGV